MAIVPAEVRARLKEQRVRKPAVHVREFLPVRPPNPDTALIFIPGVFLKATDESIAGMVETYARVFDMKTYAMTTELSEKGAASPAQEAALIVDQMRQLTEKTGIKHYLVAGMSYGGSVATSVAAASHEIPEFSVDGLGLVSPRGADRQSRFHIVTGVATDAAGTVLDTLLHLRKRRGEGKIIRRYLVDSTKNATRDMFYGQFVGVVDACVPRNHDTRQIDVPVAVVTGSRDRLAHPNNLVPLRTDRGPARRSYNLRRSVFPNAPDLRMEVIPGGHHAEGLVNPSTFASTLRTAFENMKVMQKRPR